MKTMEPSSLLLPLATTALSLFPQLAAGACCESARACEQLRASTSALCAPDEVCANLNALSQTTLRLNNNDMRPLELAQKDLAGTYRLDISTMRVVNEWAVGDAPGITRPGRSEVAVHRICADSRQVEVSGSVFLFGFDLVLANTNLSATREVDGRIVIGLVGSLNGIKYFFTPASR